MLWADEAPRASPFPLPQARGHRPIQSVSWTRPAAGPHRGTRFDPLRRDRHQHEEAAIELPVQLKGCPPRRPGGPTSTPRGYRRLLGGIDPQDDRGIGRRIQESHSDIGCFVRGVGRSEGAARMPHRGAVVPTPPEFASELGKRRSDLAVVSRALAARGVPGHRCVVLSIRPDRRGGRGGYGGGASSRTSWEES